MGENPATVHLTGCPSIDLLDDDQLAMRPALFSRKVGVGPQVDPARPYMIVLQHPVTTEYGDGFAQISQTLAAVQKIGLQTIWLWPNVDAGSDDVSKGLRMFRESHPQACIHFYRNFAVEEFACLLNNAVCIVGNSSSALREGAWLGVPAINIGTRQAGREHGPNVVHAMYDAESIENAIRSQLVRGRYPRSPLFGDGTAGRRIANVLAEVDVSIQKRLAY